MSYDNPSTAERRRAAKIIGASGLFDENYYLNEYPEVARSELSPLDHFIAYGASEGRNPNKDFNTVLYLAEHSHIYAKGLNPLAHYVEYGKISDVDTGAVSEVQAFDAFDRALRSGMFTASPTAERIESVSFGFTGVRRDTAAIPPLPPLQLAQRVGSPTLQSFEDVGRDTASTIKRCISPFSFAGKRCMDFGCGAGRVIRHFAAEADDCEFWGCDIDGTSIYWLMEHANPPFNFFQLGDAPLLPFEDNSFDLICAIGVFCQVFKDWQLWALEIRRVLKPGGTFMMTYNGQAAFEMTFPHGIAFDKFMSDRGMYVMKPYLSWNQGGPQVIHSTRWVEKMWGNLFDIDYIACGGLMDFHDICMMRKPAAEARRAATPVPIHKLSTSQAFNPKAIGRVVCSFDETRPFLESYGIEADRGRLKLSGWISFADDKPLDARLKIDDVEIDCQARFRPDGTLQNWNTDRHAFTVEADCRSAPLGRHVGSIDFVGAKGTRHTLSVPLRLS